jgi:uncharacterized membrane protein (UPF0127 family)
MLTFIIIYTLVFNHQYGLLIIDVDKSRIANLVVKIADGEEERVRGLSGKKYLLSGFAMLFILDSQSKSGIWMKDMNFPIDVYWFKKDLTNDSFIKDIKPSTYPNVFYSQGDVLYVLETKVNAIDKSTDLSLTKNLTINLTYINKHDKNMEHIWQILQHLLFHLK